MQVKHIALATLLAATFAGSAFAAQPEAGEGPLFLSAPTMASALSREAVRQQAIIDPPAAGIHSGAVMSATPSMLTRSQVRQATLDAIAHGVFAKSGEMS